jgi:hypothetical protein
MIASLYQRGSVALQGFFTCGLPLWWLASVRFDAGRCSVGGWSLNALCYVRMMRKMWAVAVGVREM